MTWLATLLLTAYLFPKVSILRTQPQKQDEGVRTSLKTLILNRTLLSSKSLDEIVSPILARIVRTVEGLINLQYQTLPPAEMNNVSSFSKTCLTRVSTQYHLDVGVGYSHVSLGTRLHALDSKQSAIVGNF